MATYNKSGMLQAVLAKFTRIDMEGAPLVGEENIFWSDAMISISFTAAYNKQDDVSIVNGAGRICTTFSPPQTLLRMDIGNINFCYPDPAAIEFLAGGIVFTDADADDAPIGYAFPPVGVDPKPAGVAMELWSSQIRQGSVQGYFHWLMPRVYLQFTKDQNLDGTNAFDTGLDGIAQENVSFGDGPSSTAPTAGPGVFADWPITSRVCQWMQEPSLPTYSYGYAPVVAATA
jgi:hypothetical protein